MYTRFAQVYDRLMKDYDYAAWAEFYLALLRGAGVQPKLACECACGTGSMSLALMARGVTMIGVDSSEDMLQHAQQKARDAGVMLPLVCQDMRALALHRPVDALICPCDGVNYLLSGGDLARFFAAAFAAIRPGGALAFDISSESKLRALAQGVYGEDLHDLTYFWQNQWEPKGSTVRMELCFFLRRPDGLYARFDEHQVQRAHRIEDIQEALSRAGFADIKVFGDRHMLAPREDEPRLHFVARRP